MLRCCAFASFSRETHARDFLSDLIFSAQVCYPESRRTSDCR
ncbi:hypothetical protein RB2306 [Rhodopirellula baltica SH 1]|uniref:Uncharacterized protein n=1 Tax=Rhodopirellula baltica (strain DSM 10527 / NCIMB 13988 / SH1) TaxID=243090 RepID=Q7UW27_RHOBA|nr:hypothetical protein RB2306 [Rhodopirellula baltica SH 1]